MTSKLKKIPGYLRELLFMLIFRPLGAIGRHICPSLRGLWLISERGTDARDNGYRFYSYLVSEHPEVNARYVITPGSPDRPLIDKLGGAVNYRSPRHYIMYYAADALISTHVQPAAPDKVIYFRLAQHGLHARGRQVYLKHGIINNAMDWLHYGSLYIDLFVCGAKPEYDHVRSTFGFPEGVVRYLGLCRYDSLQEPGSGERMILLMPTWRGSGYPSGDAFYDTEYCRSFRSLLASPELARLLEESDTRLVFYPHIEMQRYIDCFRAGSDRITIADAGSHDVQQLLRDCALLITDHSSVFFDVAYLGKPIIYYQFDEEEFRSMHYREGYFDCRRDGFGPVCTDEAQLLSALRGCIVSGMMPDEEYKRRAELFFPLRDKNNCRRTYEAVCEITSDGR